jgi:hypothetical protein
LQLCCKNKLKIFVCVIIYCSIFDKQSDSRRALKTTKNDKARNFLRQNANTRAI